MTCDNCPERLHHVAVFGWHECTLTGAQVYPRGDTLLLCPRVLPVSERMGMEAREVARTVLLAAYDRERFRALLGYYAPSAQLRLCVLLQEALAERKRGQLAEVDRWLRARHQNAARRVGLAT